MFRHMRNATVGVAVFYLWLYLTGPMGMVVGGVAFLGGFALGHHAGYRDGILKMRNAWDRSNRVVRLFPREGDTE